MTRDSVIKLLMMIQAAYPNYKPPDKTIAVNMWYEMLKECDEASVIMGLKEFIKTDTSGFAPSIGQIISKMETVQRRNQISELESMLLAEGGMKIDESNSKMIGSK